MTEKEQSAEDKIRSITHPEEDYQHKLIVSIWEREDEVKVVKWITSEKIEFVSSPFYHGENIDIHCSIEDEKRILKKIEKLTSHYSETTIPKITSDYSRIGRKFRFHFTGVQTNELGFTREIRETYDNEVYSLGEALYKLYNDYERVKLINVYEDKSEAYAYVPLTKIHLDSIKDVKHIKCKTEREISPHTGTYKYYRRDNPDINYWYGKPRFGS